MNRHMLPAEDFRKIRNWMVRNARPLEISLWNHTFEEGSRTDVLWALGAYQNPDGGFGHALEPDCWNPVSSPLQTWTACTCLGKIGAPRHDPLVRALIGYLQDGPDFADGLWRSTIPSNNEAPHAPWWGWVSNEASRGQWGYNPSAALAGYALAWASVRSPLFRRAAEVALAAMEDALNRGILKNRHLTDCHRTLLRLIDSLPDTVDTAALFPRKEMFCDLVRKNTLASIDRDPAAWFVSYATLPTDLIQSPDDPLYAAEQAAVESALDKILDTRDEEGVWDISWTWSDYPEAFAVSRRWWRSAQALERVRLLCAYGRIEGVPPERLIHVS